MKIDKRIADMEQRRPNWRKRQWLQLAALNVEDLEKKNAEVKRLTAEVDEYQQQQDEIIVALGSSGILPSEIVKEIERLTAEVSRLRELIYKYVDPCVVLPEEENEIMACVDAVSGKQSSEFSRFIREGTAEEKAEVFERVIDESNKAQQDTVDSSQNGELCDHGLYENEDCPECAAADPRVAPLYEDLVSDLKAHDHCGDECVVCDLIVKSELALTRLLTERADRLIATDHADEQNNDS